MEFGSEHSKQTVEGNSQTNEQITLEMNDKLAELIRLLKVRYFIVTTAETTANFNSHQNAGHWKYRIITAPLHELWHPIIRISKCESLRFAHNHIRSTTRKQLSSTISHSRNCPLSLHSLIPVRTSFSFRRMRSHSSRLLEDSSGLLISFVDQRGERVWGFERVRACLVFSQFAIVLLLLSAINHAHTRRPPLPRMVVVRDREGDVKKMEKDDTDRDREFKHCNLINIPKYVDATALGWRERQRLRDDRGEKWKTRSSRVEILQSCRVTFRDAQATVWVISSHLVHMMIIFGRRERQREGW